MERERQEGQRKWKLTRNSPPYRRNRQGGNNFFQGMFIFIFLLSGLLAVKNNYNITLENNRYTPVLPEPHKPISISVGNSTLLQSQDYTEIDRLAFSIDYDGTSVQELANKLQAHSTTDLEKARIIYTWIADNITYDVEAYFNNNYTNVTPEEVLETRLAVCSGYAQLFQSLAEEMGLKSYIINGSAKGVSYIIGEDTQINHGWNGVKIDNQWYLIDSTWGAGHIKNKAFVKNFNPFYFAPPPEQFIYTHFPSDSDWQLLSNAYSKQQFEALPETSSYFFKYGLGLVSHKNHTIQGKNEVQILLNVPDNIILSSRLFYNDSPQENNYTLIQPEGNQARIYVTFPSAGIYELKIFAKPKGQEGFYNYGLTYRIIADEAGDKLAKSYQDFSDNKVYLMTPLYYNINANNSVFFNLYVPNAQEVQVINDDSSQWTKLSEKANVFEGYVPLQPGKVIVVAKFSDHSSYQYLVEYEAN